MGNVTSGRGNGKRHLSQCKEELRRVTDENIYLGSLNVILSRPIRFREELARTFDNDERSLWPAVLNGRQVWVYRWARAPLHVAEIISATHFRDELKLADGDEVSLQIEGEFLAPLPLSNIVAWAMFWLGRRQWCYTNDRYYYGTANWCRRLGAIQDRRNTDTRSPVAASAMSKIPVN